MTNAERELPQRWVWSTLGEAFDVIMGQSPPSHTYNVEGKGLPFFQGKAEFGPLHPTPVKWCSEPGKIAQAGDVLISVRAPVGPTNLCVEESCIGRGLAAIRPKNNAPSQYVLYWLKLTARQLAEQATGTTFAAISGTTLRNHPIPFAPMDEQRRIVAKIEELFSRLDAGVAALKRVQAALKRYKASVLKAACEGQLVPQDPSDEPATALLSRILDERRARWEAILRTNGKDPKRAKYEEPIAPITNVLPTLPDDWCWASLSQVSWDAGYGTSQKCEYEADGPPVIRIPNITAGSFDLGDLKHATLADELPLDGDLSIGDFVVIRTNGSKDLIGRAGYVRQPFSTPHYFASYLIRYRLLSTQIGDWLAAIWDSGFLRGQIEQSAATSAGQYNVSVGSLNRIVFPLPPLQLQKHIIAELDRQLSILSKLDLSCQFNLDRASRLRQSILSKAFNGQLRTGAD